MQKQKDLLMNERKMFIYLLCNLIRRERQEEKYVEAFLFITHDAATTTKHTHTITLLLFSLSA